MPKVPRYLHSVIISQRESEKGTGKIGRVNPNICGSVHGYQSFRLHCLSVCLSHTHKATRAHTHTEARTRLGLQSSGHNVEN